MKIMKLSKNDRRILQEPCAIARENKVFRYKIQNDNCLMHGQEIDNLLKDLSPIILLTEKLEFSIQTSKNQCSDGLHGSHLELASLILLLPESFNDAKLSIKIDSTSGRQFDIEKFMGVIGEWRKDLVFHAVTYQGS